MWKTLKISVAELILNVGMIRFVSTIFLVALIAVFLTFEPLFFGKIISELEKFYSTGYFNTDLIIRITAIWLLYVFVAQWIKFFIWQNVSTKTTVLDYNKTVKKYCTATLDMSMWEYLWKNIGSIYKLINKGTDNRVFFFFSFFESYLFSWVSIFVIIIILFTINVKMALISLSLLPVMIALWCFFTLYNTPKQKKLSMRWEKIFDIVWNAMSNYSLFKVLCLEKEFKRSIFKNTDEVYHDQMSLNKYWNLSEIYTIFLIMLSRVLVLGFWIFYVKNWVITLAELFVIFTYIGWIYFPLGFLFKELKNSVNQLTEMQRMYDILGKLENDLGSDLWKVTRKPKWNIAFKGVNFWYTEDKEILKNIDFEIKPWKKIALVWNTWAGKSTIVNLLLRFWDIEHWNILLDGVDIKELKKSSLRSHIGVVSQDNSLFNLSIEENLKFANPKATKKDIEQALKNAEAEFVFDLKDGIKTVIWERWLKLSGGEKQRISIARLFLKNPEILVLDEATSALDNLTEKKIEKALKKLMKWKTSIIIAHRLSTIQHVDKIFVLENGKVVEEWNYDELMKSKNKFYNLANPDKLILW